MLWGRERIISWLDCNMTGINIRYRLIFLSMRIALFTGMLLLCCYACSDDKTSESDPQIQDSESELKFEKSRWSSKDGRDYPFRDQMLSGLIYNDTVRTLNKSEILELLGEPERSSEGHLYYMVAQKRIGSWPLHTKSLVIKFSSDTIEWMKIHE